MKLDYKNFVYFVACFLFFSFNNSYAASSPTHCQPQDLACLQSMSSNKQPADSKTPIRKYDASGRVIAEQIGDTTTYYTYDENGKQVQQYKETSKSSASK